MRIGVTKTYSSMAVTILTVSTRRAMNNDARDDDFEVCQDDARDDGHDDAHDDDSFTTEFTNIDRLWRLL